MSVTVTLVAVKKLLLIPLNAWVFSDLESLGLVGRGEVRDTLTVIEPRSVYLQAFVSRFNSICHSHSSSVRMVSQISEAMEKVTGTCFPYPSLHTKDVYPR